MITSKPPGAVSAAIRSSRSGVLLLAEIGANPSAWVIELDGIQVQTDNQTFLEVVAPEQQRATFVHTQFKQAHFPILELVEILLVAS